MRGPSALFVASVKLDEALVISMGPDTAPRGTSTITRVGLHVLPKLVHAAGADARRPDIKRTVPGLDPIFVPAIVTNVPGAPSRGATSVIIGCSTHLPTALQIPLAHVMPDVDPPGVQVAPEQAPHDPPQFNPVSSLSCTALKQCPGRAMTVTLKLI